MTTRGTSNGNETGNAEDRRRRRAWLLETYRADVDLLTMTRTDGKVLLRPWPASEPVLNQDTSTWTYKTEMACRCYRCGMLLTLETLTVDRIIPGCQGGRYRRDNIRPACGPCNSETGGRTRRLARKGK